jgi:uncharacterized membrane protein YfcA
VTEWAVVLPLGLALFTGAFVQGTIGFGMALVAAPFVVFFAPELMPGALLVTSFSLPVVQLAHAPVDIAWRPLGLALGGRALLTPVGVVVVALMSVEAISVLVGLLVLLSVAASVWAVEVRATDRNAAVAGALAGISGTAASIGGPFLALVLQHERPTRLRSTLSAFFLAGTAFAVVGLLVVGEFTGEQLRAGLSWIPFIALGYAAAGPLRERLDRGWLRLAVLWFCTIAGASVVVRALLA